MNNTETLKLIDGQFVNDDASELLMNIFSSRINYYKVRNFSSYIRFGYHDEAAQQRIVSLREEMKKLQRVLAEARAQNKKLAITSAINISIEDD